MCMCERTLISNNQAHEFAGAVRVSVRTHADFRQPSSPHSTVQQYSTHSTVQYSTQLVFSDNNNNKLDFSDNNNNKIDFSNNNHNNNNNALATTTTTR